MDGIIVSGIEPVRKRRTSRFIFIGAGLVAASLIAGLMAFTWLSAMDHPATPGSDAPPGVHLNVPHHFRF
jgi:hypothetical protein